MMHLLVMKRRLLPTILTLCLALPAASFAQDSDADAPLITRGQEQAVESAEATLQSSQAAAGAEVETAEPELAGRDKRQADFEQYVDTIRTLVPSMPEQMDTGTMDGLGLSAMPQDAASQAGDVDFLYQFILWVCYIFGGIVIIAMFWFLIKYRARSDDEPDPTGTSSHSTTLEITWTVIPTCIVLVMFTLGFRGYLNDTIAPPNAYKINVVGGSWYWQFEYPNGAILEHLHLPKDRPVEFTLKSMDVIHSIYIPAFRMKKDVVPGRFNKTWTTPTVEGVFELFCTEYCGTLHSQMAAKVFVYEPEDFEVILEKFSDLRVDPVTGEERPPAEVGAKLWQVRGCAGCHSVDGAAMTGPTWKDLWNKPNHAMVDGTVVEVNEDYIRESIFYPQRQIVAGYGNAMASYLGVLSERDVSDIIAYMKTISSYTEEMTEAESAVVEPGDEG
ncbi:MAG: cytochrome c oxidase subunit II [Planctomycetota bacterium]